jgi:predicted metal-dependent phosphoesterase TrpH
MSKTHCASVLIVTLSQLGASTELFGAEGLWVKGNTHAHTTLSDGNATAEEVVRWYEDHGYQFLVLTDHDKTAPMALFDRHSDAGFVVIPGVELSATRKFGEFNVHINAIGIRGPMAPLTKPDIREALIANMEMIARAGAIAQLNHPSFHLRDPNAISAVSGTFLMEVYNHSTRSDTYAPIGQPLYEHAYEAALTAGKRAYAIATDDTHDYRVFGPKRPNPGGGWIMVRVAKLTRDDVLRSLAAGDFYASTGVEIDQYAFGGKEMRVCVQPVDGVTHTIWFIGRGGMPLKKVMGTAGSYHLRGSPVEAYVRVRVNASDGTAAWLQPIWPAGGN